MGSKRPVSLSSKTPSLQAHGCIRTSTVFMPVCSHGATMISVSTMDEASLPAMKMGMAFAKCTYTPWKAFGLSAELAVPASGYFPRETPSLPGFLRVRSQHPQTRQSVASCGPWGAVRMTCGPLRPGALGQLASPGDQNYACTMADVHRLLCALAGKASSAMTVDTQECQAERCSGRPGEEE